MKFLSRLLPVLFFAPALVLAAGELTPVSGFIENIITFMNNTLVPAIFAVAFLVFLWGMFKTFILGGSNEEKQKEGKQLLLYTIMGFVIMISLWGIVNLISAGLNLNNNDPILPPILPSFLRN